MGDTAIHFEIWSDKTSGCPNLEPHCPDQKLGDDSDDFLVDGLPLLQGTGACGSTDNGQEVTITWSGTKPNPGGNFWIVGVNNSPGGITTGQVRWGASGPGLDTVHADGTFDAWKGGTDRDNDFYFIVRIQP